MYAHLDRKKDDAPLPEIAEVSIFGNGCGESILIHLGFGEWAIFDSCLNPNSKRPAPLEYLENIGITPSSAVKLFLISHWHSDHIKGGSEIIRACSSADFSCSDLLFTEQMIQLADVDNHIFMRPLAVSEFNGILQELKKRGSPKWAVANRKIFSSSSMTNDFTSQIYSLSPSDAEKSSFLSEIGLHLQRRNNNKKEIISKKPNSWSVVPWLSIGIWNILLGADLEQTADSNRGWSAILMSKEKPVGKAKIFKIPHHGSRNAHNLKVWQEMMTTQPIALVSPFDSSSLPSQDDVTRICQLANESYSAALLKAVHPRRRSNNTVERQLKELSTERKVIGGKFGQVRVRFNPLDQNDYEISLFDQAIALCGN